MPKENLAEEIRDRLRESKLVLNIDDCALYEQVLPSLFASVTAGLVMYHDVCGATDKWPCISRVRLALQEHPSKVNSYSFTMSGLDDSEEIETSEKLLTYIMEASLKDYDVSFKDTDVIRIMLRTIYDWSMEYKSCLSVTDEKNKIFSYEENKDFRAVRSPYFDVTNIVKLYTEDSKSK